MFLKKLKILLPYDPAILLLGIYPEKTKTLIRKDTCTSMFTAALFTIAKTWKRHKHPATGDWFKETWGVVCVCIMEYYPVTKRIKHCHLYNMDGPREYHTKWSKSEKDKYYITIHTLLPCEPRRWCSTFLAWHFPNEKSDANPCLHFVSDFVIFLIPRKFQK